jgi:hypothetical protein
MLTDIFAHRYAGVPLFAAFGEADRRLLVQAFLILDTDLMPYWDSKGGERSGAAAEWKAVHDKLCRELGLPELSPRAYTHTASWNGQTFPQVKFWSWDYVCRTCILAEYKAEFDPDEFIKRRLSFIEVALRDCEQRFAHRIADLV